MEDTNNNNSQDSTVFNLEGTDDNHMVAPGQTTMFESPAPEVTKMEIPHAETMEPQAPAPAPAPAAPAPTQHEEEGVSSGTKLKILATLVIVGIAGYAAYWVQEPVQLKTDVLDYGSTPANTPGSTPTTDAMATASGDTVAANTPGATTTTTTTTTTTGESVNVDVSLFGFDPAVLEVGKGTTIVWTNTSTEDQTIIGTATNGQSFASPVLTSGQTFNYKFDQDTDFEYYSTYNPALKATIKVGAGTAVVADPSAPTTEGNTPSTDATTSAPLDPNAPTTPDMSVSDLGLGTTVTTETTTTTALPTTTAYPYDLSAVTPNSTLEELHAAASATGMTPTKLSETGPAENLYALILLGVVWFNRKKLAKVFQK